MKYSQEWVNETKRLQGLASQEQREVGADIHSLELKRERAIARIVGLDYILAEIHTKQEQLLRIQKPTCWAMAGTLD